MMIIRAALAAALALTVLVAPFAADTQQTGKVPRVGVLLLGSRSDPVQRVVDAFQQGLRELGYVEGQSIAIQAAKHATKAIPIVIEPALRKRRRRSKFLSWVKARRATIPD